MFPVTYGGPLPPLNGGGGLPPPRVAPPAFTELCQLALDWEPRRPTLGPDWVAEEKHDGIRLLWVDGEFRTREGDPFHAAEHLRPAFERMERRAGEPMFFDSEYVEDGGFLATLSAFRRGHGAGKAKVFDGLPLKAWRAGSAEILLDRRARLRTIFDGLDLPARLIEQRPAPWIQAQVLAMAEGVWKRGGEGLMLKQLTAPYIRGRAGSWLKVKRSLKVRARVLEVLHDGGALRCEHGGRRFKVAVPPAQRPHMGAYLVGMEVLVEAMEWTEKGSLRQPRLEAYPSPPVHG